MIALEGRKTPGWLLRGCLIHVIKNRLLHYIWSKHTNKQTKTRLGFLGIQRGEGKMIYYRIKKKMRLTASFSPDASRRIENGTKALNCFRHYLVRPFNDFIAFPPCKFQNGRPRLQKVDSLNTETQNMQ